MTKPKRVFTCTDCGKGDMSVRRYIYHRNTCCRVRRPEHVACSRYDERLGKLARVVTKFMRAEMGG